MSGLNGRGGPGPAADSFDLHPDRWMSAYHIPHISFLRRVATDQPYTSRTTLPGGRPPLGLVPAGMTAVRHHVGPASVVVHATGRARGLLIEVTAEATTCSCSGTTPGDVEDLTR